jgi:hypothetical protein
MIKIPNALLAKRAQMQLMSSKHAPNALFVGGIVGGILSTVFACRATLKVAPMVSATASRIEAVKADPNVDQRKEIAKAYAGFALDVTKAYGPAVVLGVSSVGMLTKSHSMLNTRVEGLTAAYAVAQESLDSYRKATGEIVGDEKEKEIRDAAYAKQHESLSTYARCFDEQTPYFQKHAASNMNTIVSQLNWANVRFNAQGYLFLNDIYDALGFPKTAAGQVVGWVKSHHHPSHDNYIDFGLWNHEVNPDKLEPRIWLDFNVDGVVLDLVNWDRT